MVGRLAALLVLGVLSRTSSGFRSFGEADPMIFCGWVEAVLTFCPRIFSGVSRPRPPRSRWQTGHGGNRDGSGGGNSRDNQAFGDADFGEMDDRRGLFLEMGRQMTRRTQAPRGKASLGPRGRCCAPFLPSLNPGTNLERQAARRKCQRWFLWGSLTSASIRLNTAAPPRPRERPRCGHFSTKKKIARCL